MAEGTVKLTTGLAQFVYEPNYRQHRFPPQIISSAVWLYHRFCLSFRDVEDFLAECGVIVS